MRGATPAVWEPRPNCWRVFASSLPVGFRPCASWNFLVASIVAASHFPFGFPVNEPSFASACWISEIRSVVGAFCPRSRRLDRLEVLFPREAPPALEEAAFFGVAACACPKLANTHGPAARSSVRARLVAFRTRMMISVWFRLVVTAATIAERQPVLCQTNRVSAPGRCPAGEEP